MDKLSSGGRLAPVQERKGPLPGVEEKNPGGMISPRAGYVLSSHASLKSTFLITTIQLTSFLIFGSVFGIHSPELDENSTEGKIARLEKRLKRNLPAEIRSQVNFIFCCTCRPTA